jgi:hypothetical protein
VLATYGTWIPARSGLRPSIRGASSDAERDAGRSDDGVLSQGR